jgi:hypothetical protein
MNFCTRTLIIDPAADGPIASERLTAAEKAVEKFALKGLAQMHHQIDQIHPRSVGWRKRIVLEDLIGHAKTESD